MSHEEATCSSTMRALMNSISAASEPARASEAARISMALPPAANRSWTELGLQSGKLEKAVVKMENDVAAAVPVPAAAPVSAPAPAPSVRKRANAKGDGHRTGIRGPARFLARAHGGVGTVRV